MNEQSSHAVKDFEVFAAKLDPKAAAETYNEHGCLVVSGFRTFEV